jgi:hypothetical protein
MEEDIKYCTTGSPAFTIGEVWTPTTNLRFVEKLQYNPPTVSMQRILQQEFVSNLGDSEWREIPIVSE